MQGSVCRGTREIEGGSICKGICKEGVIEVKTLRVDMSGSDISCVDVDVEWMARERERENNTVYNMYIHIEGLR